MSRTFLRGLDVALVTLGVGAAVFVGSSVHRRMWQMAELMRYRAAVRELTQTMQSMRPRAMAQQRTLQLRVDSAQQTFELTAWRGEAAHAYAVVERTIWLPRGLQIAQAPDAIIALPSGEVPPASILITAPAHQRLFRVTARPSGRVEYDEEPTL